MCEIQFDGFVFPAFDQIVSQVAKMHYRSAGNVKLPITIRIPYGGGIGAVEHHSESPESYFAHTAGLKVVSCSNPVDAYSMIQQAIACDDPIVFFEPKRRYWDKAEVDLAVDTRTPLWSARVVREGTDATLITYGPSVRTCLEAAAAAASEGRELEVVDLRALSPIDWDTVFASVRKTGHAIVVVGGAGLRVARRRDRGADQRAVLLLAGGAGAAGRRLLDAVPDVAGRGGLPARPRPHPRRRRPLARVLRGRRCRRTRTSGCPTSARG